MIKKYGDFIAISKISLKIDYNECVGLIGPNGAGKTTLFQCLMGMLKIKEGDIYLLGRCVVKNGKKLSVLRNFRSEIGYVPDFQKIYPFLTVEEYLRFLGKLFGLVPEELALRISFLIHTFNLEAFSSTLVKNLSRGNHQKLMLCSALIHQPSLLLLDEPFTGLDVYTRKKAKDIITKFTKVGISELGIEKPGTVIISSHILSDIEDLCKRFVIINSGNLIWDGRIEDLNKIASRDSSLEKLVLKLLNYD